MQALVIAHAAFGHNHFFKNNYLFRQWTDADGILDYLEFAKTYIAECEERYGHGPVERLLDAAHALMNQAVHRYPRKMQLDLRSEERRERERRQHEEQMYNDLLAHGSGQGTHGQRRCRSGATGGPCCNLPQEKPAVFSGEDVALNSRPGSANACASCG